MKTNLKLLIIACCILGALLQLHSQGYIVDNGVVYVGNYGFGYEFDVIQNPTNSDYTGFFLQSTGKTPPTVYTNTFSFSVIVDEGVRVFLVSSNDPVSLQPILSQHWTELGYAPSYVFTNGVPFYLGFYTGFYPWDSHGTYTGIYSNPVFGWGRFVNNQGVMQLLDSAAEIGGGGIYAGTSILIPVKEPSGIALASLGALLLGFRRMWKAFYSPM